MNSTPPYPYNKRVTFKTLILKHSLKYDHKNPRFLCNHIYPALKGRVNMVTQKSRIFCDHISLP
jgi:hypothetical protein